MKPLALDRTAEFFINDTPPSLNDVGGRGGYRVWSRHKRRWQTDVEAWLLVLTAEGKLPPRVEFIAATATLSFPTRRRRDVGNYAALLDKALGDALVGDRRVWPDGRWLPDDTPTHYRFGGLEFAHGRPQTRIALAYASSASSPEVLS